MADKIVNFNDITKVKDMTTLNLLKEGFERAYNNQKEQIEIASTVKDLENRTFGYIKESFENLSGELFKTKGGRAIIRKYISCIKESDELSKMHALYECVRKADKNLDVDSYLNEATSMIGLVDSKKYDGATKKLASVLGEAFVKLGKDSQNNFAKSDDILNEAIDYVATHKKTVKNLPERSAYYNVIKESIKNSDVEYTFVREGSEFKATESAINEFNEKYGEALDESSQDLVKELMTSTNKETIFNKYKDECVAKINEKKDYFDKNGDATSSERLGIILEKVNQRKYNPETVNTDVFNLVEMAKSLDK